MRVERIPKQESAHKVDPGEDPCVYVSLCGYGCVCMDSYCLLGGDVYGEYYTYGSVC